jgi:hypothetical protein
MLPDFPKVKSYISRCLVGRLRNKVHQSDPLLSLIKRRTQFEGNRHSVSPKGGPPRTSGFETLSSEFKIPNDELIEKGPGAFAERIDKVAQDLIKGASGMMIRTMRETSEQTGNVIDSGGKPLTPDLLLQLMQKVEMDFDDNGNPTNMAFVVSPDIWEKYKDKIREWDNDPGIIRRREIIMQEKRREWRDRENNRKLVD